MSISKSSADDLVWDIATLYPPQGEWSDEGYLALTATTNRLIEFTDGRVEFLAMPTKAHQLMLMFLLDAIRRFRDGILGLALPAPLRVRIRDGKFREPDIVFMRTENERRAGDKFYDGADLVMEIVSDDPESRNRDCVEKVFDYAEAGILEYWIVDAVQQRITICSRPRDGVYDVTTVFQANERAVSSLLAGFGVDVADVMASSKRTQ